MPAQINREGSVIVVKPVGPMIAAELEELDRQLQDIFSGWTPRIVVNLSEVPFIDSAGLELLCRCRNLLGERGLSMKLCLVNEMTRQILELTRLTQRFDIYPDVIAAVRSFL
ncbi:MAG: STAS domain-containing protein [Sedimentisphaerales bacterium]|nr:STAS domain-containing protein [Sedimentisphaerales bacterium]